MREARSFVAMVDGLNSVPGMMTSHDLGKECMARALLAIAEDGATFNSAMAKARAHAKTWGSETDRVTLSAIDALARVIAVAARNALPALLREIQETP